MKKTQKKPLLYEIDIPAGVEVSLDDFVNVTGPKGEVKRKLKMPGSRYYKISYQEHD